MVQKKSFAPIDPKSSGLPGLHLTLRSQASSNLPEDKVKAMLKQHDFFDTNQHKEGKGLAHLYLPSEREGEKLVIDYATGLTWQQAGSSNSMVYSDVEKYVRELNTKRFAGYEDWRLPSLEEAMSLMEREKRSGDLYIAPVFGRTQIWIWTADKQGTGRTWVAYFNDGLCSHRGFGYVARVRAVR